MEDRNTSTTTNESLREAGKQSNPVMYGRGYSPFTSMCAYCGNNNMNHITCKVTG